MKIVVLDGYTLNPGDLTWEGLAELGDLTVYDRTLPIEIVDRAQGAEILFTNKVILSREVLDHLPELRNGKWTGHRDFCYQSTPQTEIVGKTLGIIGFGKIGQNVAEIGHAFGMKILFQNRSLNKEAPAWARQVSLEELLRESDFVSINCPLTPDNKEFVNRELLSLMKPSAILINTGRGPLIHETDLAEALNKGIIAGAGLDVLSTEPAQPTNPLLTARNCFITPHMAWATLEARKRLMAIAVENLRSFLAGHPRNVILS